MHNLQKQLIAFHIYIWISGLYDWMKEILGINLAQKWLADFEILQT